MGNLQKSEAQQLREIQEFLRLMQPDPRKRLIDCPYGMDYRFRGL